ncbi:uncharacterized protein LOC119666635 [Teleopsis dalmanni]|uniref:uncharacterized protein LOC119666635 n=1 Tax=Teleopsis dalmanni TaxID=139649 RepID=UPI0018CCE13D|nr:uncharacterized protein LOC119666635 [Teleopsis dalmanni]
MKIVLKPNRAEVSAAMVANKSILLLLLSASIISAFPAYSLFYNCDFLGRKGLSEICVIRESNIMKALLKNKFREVNNLSGLKYFVPLMKYFESKNLGKPESTTTIGDKSDKTDNNVNK